jgi:type IV secretion system T-DNA border endonuclease VirD1
MSFNDQSDFAQLPLTIGLSQRERNAKPNPQAYKVLSVRLREAEYACLMDQLSQLGMNTNMALRIATRRIAGYLETDEDTRTSLREISGHISRISKALINLSQAAARSGQFDLKELSRERLAFGEQFARLDARLRTILNVSVRRQDGKALLTKSMRQKHGF